MALVLQTLIREITNLSNDFRSRPASLTDVASAWAGAYHSYASLGMAGVLVPTVVQSAIETAITSNQTDFFHGLASGLESYWAAAIWNGPGFTPGASTPGTFLAASVESVLKSLPSSADAAGSVQRIAQALDTYTRAVTVTASTISVPPVVVVLPVL